MKLSVHLITWNGAKYIPHLFASLKNQTEREWELLVFDNASTDNTVALVEAATKNWPVPVTIIKNPNNQGFDVGCNRLYQQSTTPFFAILNQDMWLEPDCLEKMLAYITKHPEVAAVAPRLMRWKSALIADHAMAASLTDSVDALGLKIFRNRRVVEHYTKQPWGRLSKTIAAKNKILPVFGVSGALALFRRSAIVATAYADNTMFDETYTAYKEDVDLAYRLQNAGYQAAVLLEAVAYHDRTGDGAQHLDDWSAAKNKTEQSTYVRYHSYKNHWRTLYKNERWQNIILDLPWIVWYELKKFVWFILFDRSVLGGLKELWRERRDMVVRRQLVRSQRSTPWQKIRMWWRYE